MVISLQAIDRSAVPLYHAAVEMILLTGAMHADTFQG